MESPNHGVANGTGSRPTVAFPVGTALLLLLIFGLSGIFSFCYHWEKRRHAISRRTAAHVEAGTALIDHHVCKPQAPHMNLKQPESQVLPVIVMPGDNVPKFIAVPSPCQPPRLEKIIVDVPPPPPPKPLRTALPLI
ncbi:uncharacterized protein At5g65660-like [Henckelia pumila]|uniref:uncharacterized protein At5g65660-like n=1 Tax=Henckelia pumila TaxID=405737 RepID=UPI003C6E89C3